MALTYLYLVNTALHRLNEVELTSSTFATATGFHATVKDYVNEAIYDINISELEWPFNKLTVTTPLAAGVYTMNLAPFGGNMAVVDWESFYCQSISVPTQRLWMKPMDYDEWRQRYYEPTAPFTTDGQPSRIVNVPNGFTQAHFWPPTDTDQYQITHEEYRLPARLINANDTTTIPDAFEQVIIDKVMQYAYEFRSNTDSATRMDARYKLGLSTMRTFLLNRYREVRDDRVNIMIRSRV